MLGELKIGSGPPAKPSSPLLPFSLSLRTALPLSVFPPSPFFQHAEELRGRFFFKKTLRWKTYIFLSTPLLRRRGAWGRRKRGKVLLSQELLLEEKGGAPPSSSSSEHFLFLSVGAKLDGFVFLSPRAAILLLGGEGLLSPLPFHVFLPPPLFPWPRFGTEDRNKGGGGKKKEGEGETVLSFLRSLFPLNKNQRAGGDQEWRKAPSRQTNRDRTRGEEKRRSSDPPRKRKKGPCSPRRPSIYFRRGKC